jgi:hypothetical protein
LPVDQNGNLLKIEESRRREPRRRPYSGTHVWFASAISLRLRQTYAREGQYQFCSAHELEPDG